MNYALTSTSEVAGGGHAERGGKGGARVTRAVGIVLGFRAEQESVKAFVGADCVDCSGAAGEHFVDVSLVGDVEHELIGWGVENTVHGDAQLDDA